jgi:hypothetical protein
MPDPYNVPAGVPPEDYQSFLQAQRQQMLANALTQASMAPLQQPETQPVHGLYVQPRTGAIQGISKIAEALLAGKASKQALQSQVSMAQALNQAYAPGGQQVSAGTPLQAAPQGSGSNTDSSDQGVQPLVQRAPGASLAQTVQQTQPTYSPVNPRNPQGLPADVVRQLAMADPAKYAAMLQGPEAVQLARLSGVPTAQAAGAALSKATQTEVRPGATVIDPISGRTMVGADPSKGEFYAVGPDGQVHAYPITNDAQIQAWRAGMQTGAQQANTPREIPMGGGATSLGYPPTPPALQGQGAPQGNPGGPAPLGGPAPAPPVAPPAQPAAAPPAAAPPLPRPAPPLAPVAPRAPAPAAPPSITAQADQRLWQTVPRMQIPNTPGQGSDKYTMDNLAAASAKRAALTDQYGSEARLADQQLQYNQRALQVLPQADVGPMSEWLTANRQRLIQAGVPESMIPASGTITPTLELNKYLKNAALQGARSIYGNRMTQNEVELQTNEMSPSAHMTASAIQSLIAQNNIQSQYQKQRAADFNTYVNQRGGDPQQFEAWYDHNRPLTRFASQAQTPPAALQRLQQNPALLPDFQAKYGWNPTQ